MAGKVSNPLGDPIAPRSAQLAPRVPDGNAKQIPSTVTLEVIESTTSYIPHFRAVGENLTKWVEDEDLIWPFVGLGKIYEGQSQFTEAEKWFYQSVKVTRDRLGERHRLVASSYNNLALLYESIGRYEEALPLHQNALEILLEQLGERHPLVATSYNNLAGLYLAMGRYEEALPLYQNALEIRLKKLGERHPDVASSYNNLALLYQSMGRPNVQKFLGIIRNFKIRAGEILNSEPEGNLDDETKMNKILEYGKLQDNLFLSYLEAEAFLDDDLIEQLRDIRKQLEDASKARARAQNREWLKLNMDLAMQDRRQYETAFDTFVQNISQVFNIQARRLQL